MASTYTANLGLELPARGDYQNDWDLPVNENFSALDGIIGGTSTITLSNANLALTKAQAAAASLIFTGSLSSPVTVSLPAGKGGVFSVLNGTTGNQPVVFDVTPSGAQGAALTLTPGVRSLVVSDGVNVYLADQSGAPPGVVLPFFGTSAPGGFLLCYGQAVSRTSFAALFAVVGTTFGPGDGSTTFGVPDLRGRVVAGADNMGGTAANVLTQVQSAIGSTGGAEGEALTIPQLPVHNHGVTDPGHSHSITDNGHIHPYSMNASDTTVQTPNNGGSAVPIGQQTAKSTNNAVTNIQVNSASTGISIQTAGSGNAHPNVQPTIVANYIIKT